MSTLSHGLEIGLPERQKEILFKLALQKIKLCWV
jgi:hypothetical protein